MVIFAVMKLLTKLAGGGGAREGTVCITSVQLKPYMYIVFHWIRGEPIIELAIHITNG